MVGTAFFFLFAGLAIACAISMVYHKNPLYSAISLVGVFVALSCIYVTLAAPFIAAVQVLIYAGAIMVLVVFVIMLLNLDDDKPLNRLRYLYGIGGGLGLILLVQTFFIFYAVMRAPNVPSDQSVTAGKTLDIGRAMYTEYLLPVEIVGILLLMAIIGGVILARRLSAPQLELVVDQEQERRHHDFVD
jgi:NADH-quinone oxidoreductase subunit J